MSWTIMTSDANSTAASDYCGTVAGAAGNCWCETAGNTIVYYSQVIVENYYPVGAHRWRPQPETEEQRQALAAAEELLKEYIGLEAFGKLHEVGYIEVDSQRHKGRKYRVPDAGGMIEVVDREGEVVDRLCVGPEVSCPLPDQTLARILLLEADEDYVLAKANSQLFENNLENGEVIS